MSSKNNREIEVKLQIEGLSLEEVNAEVHHLLGPAVKRKLHGKSTDMYWPLHGSNGLGFVRTRKFDDELNCLTVKVKDKGTNLNRKEVDIYTTDSHSKLVQFCRSLAGSPQGSIEKEYYVYWPTSETLPNVSVYKVTGDDSRVFVEIEAESVSELGEWITRVNEIFGYEAHEASGSLYDMYILRDNKGEET